MCEACLFCIYPLWCSCVHRPFPRTPEHSRRPHGPSSVQPPTRSPGAPVSIFARDVPFSDTLLSWAEELNPATDLWCCFDALKAEIKLWKPRVAVGTVGFNGEV